MSGTTVRPLRIGLDARALNTEHLRGMGKMLHELLREAAGQEDVEFVLFADEPRKPMQHPKQPRIEVDVWETRGHRLHAWEQIALPWRAWRRGCDVLHYTSTVCSYWQPVPAVVTVHDTLMWQEEQPSRYLNSLLPAAYRKADAILTNSENSKSDIVERWPALVDKINVVQLGVHDRYLTPPGLMPPRVRDMGVRAPYLLYFGGEIPRKRLGWAIDVWCGLDRPDLTLVVCGLERRSVAEWRERVPERMRDRFICLDFVEEGHLPSLYNEAAAVLYPTLYEGFGLPAVESQAVGTPVLFSAVGSLRELAGPGAVVLPPNDLPTWIAACQRALENGQIRSTSGQEWARQFTWSRVFGQVLDVYRRVARQRGVGYARPSKSFSV